MGGGGSGGGKNVQWCDGGGGGGSSGRVQQRWTKGGWSGKEWCGWRGVEESEVGHVQIIVQIIVWLSARV